MQRFLPLLVDVWRETARNLDAVHATHHIAAVLRQTIRLESLALFRLDLAGPALLLVAADGPVSGAGPNLALDPDELKELLTWAARCKAQRATPPTPYLPRAADPPGEFLVGPLWRDEGTTGLFIGRTTEPLEPVHVELAQELLEPLAAVLGNERQVLDLRARSHVAEADRRALLTKLGRESLSGEIIGGAGGLAGVMERVALVAKSDVPVLVLGETGAGKEVVARAAHDLSARRSGPFVRVNCGAIPPELIDSELFGHERGSFTGAVQSRRGWFERADGGTLFLDEVGELLPAAQVRLLRILQEGVFCRVGGQRELRVDVRIVAATNRDLRDRSETQPFREDLWYRLAVFPIQLPPLRDRPEDIPALSRHFALRAARRFGLSVRLPSPSDQRLLLAYPWPGNVRELASVIDRAAILGGGRALEVDRALGVGVNAAPAPSPPGRCFQTLDEAIGEHIKSALRASGGKVEGPAGAARLLGVNPHTLRSRMRRLELDWSAFRS